MSYRNGTYIAFDGNDTTDPTKSDMKYYGLLQAWNKSKNYTLTFSDSHKKTYQVSDHAGGSAGVGGACALVRHPPEYKWGQAYGGAVQKAL